MASLLFRSQWRIARASSRLQSNGGTLQCWKCDQVVDIPSDRAMVYCPCEKAALLPPTCSNYFTILDCAVSFQVDVKQIQQRFRKLQSVLHPDRWVNSTAAEQTHAAAHSSLINKAYSTLSNPYSRGLYLLAQNGMSIDEKDNMSTDIEFLEHMMELNEEINSEPSPDRLLEIRKDNDAVLADCVEEVGQSFDNGDFAKAKSGLAKMKYILNILSELSSRIAVE